MMYMRSKNLFNFIFLVLYVSIMCTGCSSLYNLLPNFDIDSVPDDKRVYYGIFESNADGTQTTLISSADRNFSNPALSSDNTKILVDKNEKTIAYVDDDEMAGSGIFIMNIDGSNLYQISSSGYVNSPQFIPGSPHSMSFINGKSLVLVNDDGGEQAILLAPNPMTHIENYDWFLDGTHVLISARSIDPWLHKIYIANASTNEITYLIDGQFPKISPSGEEILFIKESKPYIAKSDGTGIRPLTTDSIKTNYDANNTYQLVWSRDGNKVIYASSSGEVYAINSDGSNRVKLVDGFDPKLSPDGAKFSYYKAIDFMSVETYVYNIESGVSVRLHQFGRINNNITWTKDSQKVIYYKQYLKYQPDKESYY
jgi:Tol biopolymer transport system component